MSEIINGIDDLSKEALLNLLKDKLKELKSLNKKLDKLQEKYVSTLKETKLIQRDRDTFMGILQTIFNEEPFKIDQRAVGTYEINQLQDLLIRREEEKSKILTNLIKETNNEKVLLEDKYRQMLDVKNTDQKTQQLIKQLKQQLSELENNNTKLAKEIIELNDIISQKDQQIQHLRKSEEELVNIKTNKMLQDLNDDDDRTNRITASQNRDLELKLKQQIDKLIQENMRLEEQIVQLQEKPKIVEEQKQIKNYDLNPFSDELNETPTQGQDIPMKQSISIGVQTIIQQEQQPLQDAANMEYLKNVIFKYFLYQESKKYKEANMLMNAIMTILKMSKDERNKIEQAKGTHSGLLGYGLACIKPQLNDISLQRPVSKITQMNIHMN